MPYLLNRNNLGGIAAPIAQLSVDGVIRGQSSATYRTSQGTYFVFRASKQPAQGLQGYRNYSADNCVSVECDPERAGFALGYNYGRNEQRDRMGRRCSS